MDVEFFREQIEKNKKFLKSDELIYGCKFCGEAGDPFMHPKLEEFVSIASDAFDEVRIHTNGGIRTNQWVANLIKNYPKTYIHFGIDGTTKELNQMFRVDVNFDRAFSNMLAGSKIDNDRIVWEYIKFEHNKHDWDRARKIATENKLCLNLRENSSTWEWKYRDLPMWNTK